MARSHVSNDLCSRSSPPPLPRLSTRRMWHAIRQEMLPSCCSLSPSTYSLDLDHPPVSSPTTAGPLLVRGWAKQAHSYLLSLLSLSQGQGLHRVGPRPESSEDNPAIYDAVVRQQLQEEAKQRLGGGDDYICRPAGECLPCPSEEVHTLSLSLFYLS